MKAVMVLGGNITRIQTTHRQMLQFPKALAILATPEAPIEWVNKMLTMEVPMERIVVDFRAWDTLTHFLTLRDVLKKRGVKELRIVTDKGHLTRAVLLAKIVLLFSGIKIVGVPHPATYQDPWKRVVMDVGRAILWKCTRLHLYNPKIKRERIGGIREIQKQYLEYWGLTNPLVIK